MPECLTALKILDLTPVRYTIKYIDVFGFAQRVEAQKVEVSGNFIPSKLCVIGEELTQTMLLVEYVRSSDPGSLAV